MRRVRLDHLRSIRRALGTSQSELARLLDISKRAVQSYEQGWRPSPPHVLKLAALLLFLKRRKELGPPKPCWTVCKCDPDARRQCSAYGYRAGDLCWLVTDSCWRGQAQSTWEAKIAKCQECPVMKQWLVP